RAPRRPRQRRRFVGSAWGAADYRLRRRVPTAGGRLVRGLRIRRGACYGRVVRRLASRAVMRSALLRLVPACFAVASLFGCAEATDPLAGTIRRDGGVSDDAALPGDVGGTPDEDSGGTPGGD